MEAGGPESVTFGTRKMLSRKGFSNTKFRLPVQPVTQTIYRTGGFGGA